MKRLGHVWQDVTAFDNLLKAFYKARKGKANRPAVQLFSLDLEASLFSLQEQLMDGSYQPGDYRIFTLYERKPRQISAAPFVDRVVHHAVMNILEPALDKTFIEDSYACRKNKGVHQAVNRYQYFTQRYPYVMKLDICRYFPGIDRKLLLAKITRRVKDPFLLQLLEQIINSAPRQWLDYRFPGDDLLTMEERPCGLPIGNLSSQFFANLYLDNFDHWVKQTLKVKAYVRYVDDFVLLSDSTQQLTHWRKQLEEKLIGDRLLVHQDKGGIFATRCGVDFLGYRIWPYKRQLRNDNGWRFSRKLHTMADQYAQRKINLDDMRPSIMAWIGHAQHGETLGLRTKLFNSIVFIRQ